MPSYMTPWREILWHSYCFPSSIGDIYPALRSRLHSITSPVKSRGRRETMTRTISSGRRVRHTETPRFWGREQIGTHVGKSIQETHVALPRQQCQPNMTLAVAGQGVWSEAWPPILFCSRVDSPLGLSTFEYELHPDFLAAYPLPRPAPGTLVGVDMACRYLQCDQTDGMLVGGAFLYLGSSALHDTGPRKGVFSPTGSVILLTPASLEMPWYSRYGHTGSYNPGPAVRTSAGTTALEASLCQSPQPGSQ